MNRLVVATGNPGKVVEIRLALGELAEWSLEPLPEGIPSIEETGETFLENAAIKAEHYSRFAGELTLADDSGLCVEALGGRPGVQSARYAETAEARIHRLLVEMQAVPDDRRQGVFYCAIALARSGRIVWKAQCEVSGLIAREPAGAQGFGYDPVFVLPELNRTMAQLSTEEKNRLSARGKAMIELRKYLTMGGNQ